MIKTLKCVLLEFRKLIFIQIQIRVMRKNSLTPFHKYTILLLRIMNRPLKIYLKLPLMLLSTQSNFLLHLNCFSEISLYDLGF